ncbi:MAG: ribosome biogenesis GTPase Der [Gammaproteobacteria bacterium]|jgi:GTP-binding protein|nr:ribosome biogenesis GTPase Der [Gammaproteobacteria bacterium]MBT3724132.1 ribosome biogenesis GTPase Der [Gammaproteobacteria bacterium]MBT4193694.1 ribosome biogenesis GTPase Der [Gammaproteobacteria bacterium]MBT4451237.1 ribosome biogenesis GTPase Der [Gammaproteobacteria bacterium]MBT4859861.1 ribosome biogenesis GTPase Der [Gammaproteobacteria bacterium]
MIPVIALIGRPNVGKSTLFNALTRTRDAIVADEPGLTRDRQYGVGKVGHKKFIIVDTGGLSGEHQDLDDLMARQTLLALQEADVVLFMVDARSGINSGDEVIASMVRKAGKQTTVVLNKIDGVNPEFAEADFFALGFSDMAMVAASQRKGINPLVEQVMRDFPDEVESDEEPEGPSIAIIGRPNVGKSTLINRLVGEERVVAFDQPGTTRDSIPVPFERHGKNYTLIDTAGVRRRGKVHETVEKFSVIKTLNAIENANVVVVVVDARDGITDQDLTLLGYVLNSGRSLALAINKWDGLEPEQREYNKTELHRRLSFVDFANQHFISALHGTGVGDLMKSIDQAYASAFMQFNTKDLTDLLEEAIFKHNPPMHNGRRAKLRYAHQGGKNPPIIIIHGSRTDSLADSYKRYLSKFYIKKLKLMGTPVRIEFKVGDNPFAGKRNKLTKRQQTKKKRMMKFVKKKK